MKKNRKIIAIVGPTASGKTGVGVSIAKRFNGEIISADSRQVYRGLDLGTGKDGKPCRQVESYNAPKADKDIEYLRSCLRIVEGVPQWMIDICEPGEKFTLFDYLPLAKEAIEDIFNRGKLPVVVGGTGLYMQALLEGFELKSEILNQKSEINSKFKIINSKFHSREQLNNSTIDQLQKILIELDEESFVSLADKKNSHRLIRAIERAQDGLRMIKSKPDFGALQIGITWPKEILDERIDRRVEVRFKEGMLGEVEGLIKSGVDADWLINLGLEYKIIGSYILECHSDVKRYNQMKELLKLRIRQFAKRQMTWFKRFPQIIWENDDAKIGILVEKFLKS